MEVLGAGATPVGLVVQVVGATRAGLVAGETPVGQRACQAIASLSKTQSRRGNKKDVFEESNY